VLLLLFDGWAPAMLDDVNTPTLDRMRADGAWTHHMYAAFPTISLVNQVTISTGCWPERHGIVSNVFIDPERGRYDHSQDADWLLGCEHLHEVAERQGVRAAALGWVGRTSTTRGNLASHVSEEETFAEFPEDEDRAQQVIRLLRLDDAQRPRLILGYFKGPDLTAHYQGIDSEQTREAVRRSDAVVGSILESVKALPIRDTVTVIVTTDHGMLPVWINVNLARILKVNEIEATTVSSGTTSFLYFSTPAETAEAHRKLSSYPLYFEVFRKEQPKKGTHLGTSGRVGDLIISAHPPNFIEDIERWPWWTRWLARWGPEFLWSRFALKASHGYPARTPGMPGILYAWGAGIAPGTEIEDAEAIDLHPTVCELLGIAPGSSIDGNPISEMLTVTE
jgi:alkaline phosphatase D